MDVTKKIIISMIAAMTLGVVVNLLLIDLAFIGVIISLADIVGQIFLACLQLVVIPLVLFSILSAIFNINEGPALGKISVKAIVGYISTTIIAVIIGLAFATLFSPGQGSMLEMPAGSTDVVTAPNFADVFVNFFPKNPFSALASGNIIQVIIMAIIFGFALRSLGDKVAQVKALIDQLNVLVFAVVDWVIKVSPIGVFSLIFVTFSLQGFSIFIPLLGYVSVVISSLFFHAFFTYGIILTVFKLSPIQYFRNMRTPMLFGFSTASSAATIPLTLKALRENCGVDPAVSSFVVPIGATINMDGTAIMQGVATVFISNLYGIDLTIVDYSLIVITATLASIGTASVPSAGLIMLTMVLSQVGLPVEGIALIIGIDRLLDMIRTSINVSGDGVISCIIAKSEGLLDTHQFNVKR
jgi:Na+/H+-dicarboxylate symporter